MKKSPMHCSARVSRGKRRARTTHSLLLIPLLAPIVASLSAVLPAAQADDVRLVVDAADQPRRQTPARTTLRLPADKAGAVSVRVTDDTGRHWPAQLADLSLWAEVPDAAHAPAGHIVRELWLLIPELAAGERRELRLQFDSGTPESEAASWIDTPGESLELRFGARPVLRYQYAALDDSTPARREQTFKVYHHLFDPAGSRLVTKGPGGKYTHHRGLFYGFNRVTYGDGLKADVWHCSGKAYQSHQEVLASETGPVLGRHRLAIDWHGASGEVFAHEIRELTAYQVDAAQLIEFTSRVRAALAPVRLDGDPQHAGFHFRADNEVAEETEGQTYFLRPDGRDAPGESRNWPDRADHVDLPYNAMSFVLGDARYTAAYLDHPANPKPARYSERPYGRFGSYFEYDLDGERVLLVRYRLWLAPGELSAERLAELAADFVAPPLVAIQPSDDASGQP